MWNYLTTGLRVMVVDDDSLSLKVVGQLLKSCGFSATCCTSSTFALDTLRKKRSEFDLVLSDVFMPDVDGFKLLQMIGLELNLPVIMMSTSATTDVVFRGVTHGAVDFLIKPVRVEELRNIWQHVVRRKKDMVKDEGRENAKQGNVDGEKDRGDRGSAGAKKRKDAGEGKGKVEDGVPKKPRVTWSVEMHEQFVNAVAKLGIDKAVPKKILEIMNVSGLTRENVASHLQKYRLYLKRMDGMPQQKIHRSKHTPSETSAAARISSVPASVVPSPSAAVPATAPSLVSPNMSMVNLASHMPVMVPPIDPTNIQLQMPMGMNLASMLQPGLNPLVGLGLGMGALAPSMLPLLQHQQQVVQQLQQFGQLDARSLHVGADTSQPLLTGMTNAQPDSQYTALHQRHAALPVVSPPTPTEATSQPSPSVGGAGGMMTKDAPKASPSMRLPQAGAMGVNGQASLLAAGCISGDGVMVPVGCLGGTPANADPSVPMFQVPSQPGGEVAQVKSEGSGPDQANEEDRALLSGRVRDLAGVSGPPIFPEAGMVGFTGGHGEIGLGAVDNSFDLLQTICDRSSGLDGMDVDDAKESMMELFDEFLKGSTTNITTTTALR